MPPTPSPTSQIQITRPSVYTAASVFVVCGFGVLLGLPLVISVLAVSLMRPGILSLLIPLLVIAAMAWFLPFGLGNAYVARLVRSLKPTTDKNQEGFIVQLTLHPRIRSGIQAVVEDADDIGWLSFTPSELLFHGDSIKLSIPFDQIKKVRQQNIGLRGLFVISRIEVVVSGLPKVESLLFAERSSWLLPASRKITTKLYQQLVSHKPL